MEKRKVCFTIPEEMAREMERTKEETGVPISKQIELGLKGYEIRRVEKKEGIKCEKD